MEGTGRRRISRAPERLLARGPTALPLVLGMTALGREAEGWGGRGNGPGTRLPGLAPASVTNPLPGTQPLGRRAAPSER